MKRFNLSLISRIRRFWIMKLNPVRQALMSDGKKRLFLDCGSNLGQAVEHFRTYYPTDKYDFILFEPNPHCLKVLREKYGDLDNVKIEDGAVWTEDGTMKLYGLVEDERGDVSDGASLLAEHNKKFYESDEEKAITVPTIDLSAYIEKITGYDEIILKMNIEGSEYDVLEKMIEKDQVKVIDHMYIGFHSQFMTGDEKALYEERELKLKDYLNSRNKLYVWH